jgi:2'-5' RNA ligase
MEKYRTFIGVPLEVPGEFLVDRRQLMDALEGERISWVRPEWMHVTIRFIGDMNPEDARSLGKALRQEVELPVRAPTSFSGPGLFGPRNHPRVIWAGFEGAELYRKLFGSVREILRMNGLPDSGQEYRPHLTLGRIRSLKDPVMLHRVLKDMKGRFRGEAEAARLVFYRSILGRGGPEYLPLEVMEFPD